MKTKTLFCLVLLLAGQLVRADQLAWLTQSQANQAHALLQQEKELLLYQACAANSPKTYLDLSRSFVRYTGTDAYYEIVVEGQTPEGEARTEAIDLAYAFVQRDGQAKPLGKLLGFDCDPCTDGFPWEKPQTIDPNDRSLSTEVLIFLAAEALPQQHWKLNFTDEQFADERSFVLSLEQYQRLGIALLVPDPESTLRENPEMLRKKFLVSSSMAEVENEITGESEVVSLLRKIEPAPAKNTDQKTQEILSHLNDLRSYYTSSGLNDVQKTYPIGRKAFGLADPSKIEIPEQLLANPLHKAKVGTEDCTGADTYLILYDNNLVYWEENLTLHYFFLEDFKNGNIQLTQGMTKAEVLKILGSPHTQRSNVYVYLTPDPVEALGSDGKTDYYFGGVRLLFKDNKLKAVWIIKKQGC